ncbi:DUF3443 family protein [Bdellovibrio sp. HCB288]|uniref:DUF3443 family protein n=1 Tax=Bdellovibrio sp. HCB288 TaxID=3394355 RepID=UPI0039B682E6
MNKFKIVLILLGGFVVGMNQLGCSDGGGGTSRKPSVYFPTNLTGDNVVPLSVGACGVHGYVNEPCISVTICTPGTSQCQTIDNILVDTGSYGLKIFKSLITVPLNQVPYAGDATRGLANCTRYLDGSGHWGQVVKADVKLGNIKTDSSISIVTLDSSYSEKAKCASNPDSGPDVAGFNGIIGVGSFVEDCSVGFGTVGQNGCLAGSPATLPNKYWGCRSNPNDCIEVPVPAADQIVNPVAKLVSHNNGLVMMLPEVPLAGAGAAYGYLILGIGTDENNSGTGLTVFAQDHDATFATEYNGNTYEYSFIDSGTNFNGFPQQSGGYPALCSGDSGFYCPAALINISATMKSGSTTKVVSFEVGNMVTLASSEPYSMVYRNVAFDSSDLNGDPFDWGLPFFLGRSVYVGIYGKSAVINKTTLNPTGTTVSGPFWAF